MKKHRCYICYKPLESAELYHPICSKYLFGIEQAPKIDFNENQIEALALQLIKQKMGVTGVQRKLSLSLIKNDKKSNSPSRLTIIGYLGGEYILKPPTNDYPMMTELEDLTMHLASIAGINVAPHGLLPIDDTHLAYITKRFDRKGKNKIGVEDLCQLSNKLTEHKYKSSSENVAKVIRQHSSFPGDDALKLFELILFSHIIGNADMHLKNFSLITDDPKKIRFAPCYDLLPTKLLIPDHIDPEELALPVNGKKKNIRQKDFVQFGINCKIPEKVIYYTFNKMRDSIPLWEEKIQHSFISDEFKSQLNTLITKRMNQLSI